MVADQISRFCVSVPLAELVIGSPQWIAPAIVMGTLLTFLVLWNYSRSGATHSQTTIISIGLKLFSIALLAVCLIQPMQRGQRPRPRANLLPIVVDTSGSMDLKIGQSKESWRERIEEDFASESSILSSMAQLFETRVYGFDKRLASASEVADLRRGVTGSRLLESLDELTTRLNGRPVAGALLMSDGNTPLTTDLTDQQLLYDFPIFPVVPSQSSGLNDLRITSASVRQTNFELSPVTIQVQFAISGSFTDTAIARLVDLADETVVEERSITIPDGETTHNVIFQFRPQDIGLRFYRVDVFRDVDRLAFDSIADLIDTSSSETTLVNNTRLIAVDRGSGPYRVLYVAGRPNWEFKFLRRALSEDAEIDLTGLIRMARKEPKFSFRDKAVSSTNPLFQGLGQDAEETAEQYDEPVMIRVGVKESDELAAGFPKTDEELFAFDALILDDIEPEFFTQDQLDMVRRFVSARGGGLMMLGGQEMFQGRTFADSFLGDLSPVYIGRAGSTSPTTNQFSLTREGMLQPWMRLRKTATEENRRLASMPLFDTVNSVGSLKPGAFLLASVTSASGTQKPAVAVHRFGKGKVGAVTVGDFWRWKMRPDPNHEDDAAQNWRQMTRWLVGDVPQRAEISVQVDDDHPDAMMLRVDVLDEMYLPMENPSVNINIRRPDQSQLSLEAKPSGILPGVFTVPFYDDSPGSYIATAEIRGEAGELIGAPTTGWTQQIAGREFESLGINRTLLTQIAEKSGGAIVQEDDLSSFSNRLKSQKVPVMETWIYPLWHRGWVIALALGCLCGEWGLRRLRGLS